MAQRIKIRFSFLLLALFSTGQPLSSLGDFLSTEEIITRSVSTDCLDWKITGACIWLRCSLFWCHVVTTPKISHRWPDFVVATYPQAGESPWPAAYPSVGDDQDSAFSGGHLSGISSSHLLKDELKFFEVDVIGSPVTQLQMGTRYRCQSIGQPFVSYYRSILDAHAWRSGLPDANRHEAQQAGVREIGDGDNFTWGSVYPRAGFVFQAHAGKAAAVISQRAVDIVLRDSSGHHIGGFFWPREQEFTRGDVTASTASACRVSGGRWQPKMPSDRATKCVPQTWQQWLPNGNETTDRWQMLLPHHSRQCETFGQQPNWRHPGISASGRYLWNHWVRYQCCVKAGNVLLKHFDF